MKKCDVCYKRFDSTNPRKIYCSKECYRIGKNKKSAKYYMDRYIKSKPMNKKCIICKKSFNTNIYCKKCCSKECSLILRRQYELSDIRKKKHEIWRKSEKGKRYIKYYNGSEYGKLLKRIRNKTKKYKAFQRRYDAQPKRILARKKYRMSPEGKEVFRMICRRREARLNNVVHLFKTEEWTKKLQQTKGVCPCCKSYAGIDKLTLDHIFPLSKASEEFERTGTKRVYTIDDVQPLCRRCNRLKSNKQIIIYPISEETNLKQEIIV